MNMTRQLSLLKGAERYVFRYRVGDEAEVIQSFATFASDTNRDFDWFDAAVLSYQMGRRLETEMGEIETSP